MPMAFGELDATTRDFMLREFEAELAGGKPYNSAVLSTSGRSAFATLVRDAIRTGDEVALMRALAKPGFWNPTESYERNGTTRERAVNVAQAAERLALTEFNTWYVRGFSARLISEGVPTCQVYRAAVPKWEPAECSSHEGIVVPVKQVYDGHRIKYWPPPGNQGAFSIPFGPGCHHSIRRVA